MHNQQTLREALSFLPETEREQALTRHMHLCQTRQQWKKAGLDIEGLVRKILSHLFCRIEEGTWNYEKHNGVNTFFFTACTPEDTALLSLVASWQATRGPHVAVRVGQAVVRIETDSDPACLMLSFNNTASAAGTLMHLPDAAEAIREALLTEIEDTRRGIEALQKSEAECQQLLALVGASK